MHVLLARRAVARWIHVAMFLYVGILNVWRCISGKIASWVAVRGESGVAGEGRVVWCTQVSFLGKCTMPLTNINSDWRSNASSGLTYTTILYNHNGRVHMMVETITEDNACSSYLVTWVIYKAYSIAIFDTCPFIDVCWLVAVHVLALAEEERMAHTVELGYQAHIII